MAPAPQVGCGVKLLLVLLASVTALHATTYYVTVAGLGGEPEYEQRFSTWAKEIDKLVRSDSHAQAQTLFGSDATRARIESSLSDIAKTAKSTDALIVMLIGHGSFDGTDYKINLPGPDLSASELARFLDKIPAKRQLVVNMTSASGASLIALERPERVVIVATKGGTERNATIFARYWVEALRDASADTDKNSVISALEAYRYADQKTSNFYETQKHLPTEHALLEDTGKGEGVRAPSAQNGEGLMAARFPLMHIGEVQADTATPEKQELIAHREELEQAIDTLKYQKAAMDQGEYKKQLTALLLDLAKTQAEIDK